MIFNTDWWNYGGLTRDIYLVETDKTFLLDYTVQLSKGSKNTAFVSVKLNEVISSGTVNINIPELRLSKNILLQNNREASIYFNGNFQLWSPETPKWKTYFSQRNMHSRRNSSACRKSQRLRRCSSIIRLGKKTGL
jgi:beta-galactosidase/beta-glucuronidase